MKKLILFILVAFAMTKLWSQAADPFLFEESKTTELKSIPLIGDKAPAFVGQSTNGEVNFWKAGEDVLVHTISNSTASKEELSHEGLYNLAWFMWYKKAN